MTAGERDNLVTVIGGGIVGLSVAYELLRRGRPAEVLDRGEIAGVSTRAAAGMLAPVSEIELEDPAVLTLALDSLDRYPEFVKGVEAASERSCGYRTDGTLWVALNRDDIAELDHLEETFTVRLDGLPTKRLSAKEVFELEPHLSGRVVGGLLVERDLQVDPRALASALRKAIRRLGGNVRRDVRVERIVVADGGTEALEIVEADGSREALPCRGAVLAAGAWSTSEIGSPVSGAAIRPLKGQLVRLHGPRLLGHVVRHPDVYLVPRESGELLIGATMEEVGFDPSVTAGAVHDLLRQAWQVVPGLYDLELVEVSVGFRPASVDNRPVVGPTGIEGLWVAVGHGRQGVLLAPATAAYLAECVESGRPPEALEPFAAKRLEEIRISSEVSGR
jgi:glycine oxidase